MEGQWRTQCIYKPWKCSHITKNYNWLCSDRSGHWRSELTFDKYRHPPQQLLCASVIKVFNTEHLHCCAKLFLCSTIMIQQTCSSSPVAVWATVRQTDRACDVTERQDRKPGGTKVNTGPHVEVSLGNTLNSTLLLLVKQHLARSCCKALRKKPLYKWSISKYVIYYWNSMLRQKKEYPRFY